MEDIPVAAAKGFGSIPPELLQADPASSGPMCQCQTCGRTFNEKAYETHSKICAKVFVAKRKTFDSTAARWDGVEGAEIVKKSVKKQASAKPVAAAAKPGVEKKAKWKQQSDALRSAMKASRQIKEAQERGEDISKIKFEATAEEDDDRVACPYCGRKFAEKAAERHIPHCKESMAKKKGPPPVRRK